MILYLLDSNNPLNHPPDRGATAHLYPSEPRSRLIQEIILGMGGWRVFEELGIEAEICHLNEGHAAFAVLARAIGFMRRTGAAVLCGAPGDASRQHIHHAYAGRGRLRPVFTGVVAALCGGIG